MLHAAPGGEPANHKLVALRIALGVSQSDLASALRVPLRQIVRDERNGYRGLTAREARRVLAALQSLGGAPVVPPEIAAQARRPSTFFRGDRDPVTS